MKKLKKFLRTLCLIGVIMLASMGIGAPISFSNREKFMDNEIKMEYSVKDDDGESEFVEREKS